MGFILDYRKFSVHYLQQVINYAWRVKGAVKIVGQDSFFNLIYFDRMDDLEHMCKEGPWAVDGALLVLEKWRLDLALYRLHLNYVSIWVQFHGLPLEYHYPEMQREWDI